MTSDRTTSTGPDPAPFPAATVLGYPRIGPRRELKRAVEAHWAGDLDEADLRATAASLRIDTYARLAELGLGSEDYAIPASFSYYDHVLDTLVALGAVPERFSDLRGPDGRVDLAGYFTLARGDADRQPLEMTKWFDTNYHYLVPEVDPAVSFTPNPEQLLTQVREAAEAGYRVRPTLVGPVTFLALSKATAGSDPGSVPLDRLADVLPVYGQLLADLAAAGVAWVQLDEPALVADHADVDDEELAALAAHAYRELTAAPTPGRPQILVATPHGELRSARRALLSSGIEALAVDLVRGADQGEDLAGALADTDVHLVAGVVDGQNVWRTDLDETLANLTALGERAGGRVSVGTSTSLLHVPYTLAVETELPAPVVPWLAFAEEKVTEVITLATALTAGREAVSAELDAAAAATESRRSSALLRNEQVRRRTAALTDADFSRTPYARRRRAQDAARDLPLLPTTTIGSFPQTAQVRRARADARAKRISDREYVATMRAEIDRVVDLQTELGLDVLVHGEPERNDMVQYFAENLDGFAVTSMGWVQSYGTRCTRPPILFGDVSRPQPITVHWSTYAASRTTKPVKGMLTGPVTILAWSFVRDDQPLAQTAQQVALALREEISDLEAAGIGIIQVDEPALRELLPLRVADRPAYLEWSVGAFRLATAGAGDATQLHTHLCYSEFGDVIEAIDGLDADVTSIEAARSRMEILADVARIGFARGLGPGVYDIHSPRVPAQQEIEELLQAAQRYLDPRNLWVNPDCGLKTRGYAETEASLRHLVAAAHAVRERAASRVVG